MFPYFKIFLGQIFRLILVLSAISAVYFFSFNIDLDRNVAMYVQTALLILGLYIFIAGIIETILSLVKQWTGKESSKHIRPLAAGALTLVVGILLIIQANRYMAKAWNSVAKVDKKVAEINREFMQEEIARSKEYAKPLVHEVTVGDSLWKISEKYYGTGFEYMKIAILNNIPIPQLIFPGQNFAIPRQ